MIHDQKNSRPSMLVSRSNFVFGAIFLPKPLMGRVQGHGSNVLVSATATWRYAQMNSCSQGRVKYHLFGGIAFVHDLDGSC